MCIVYFPPDGPKTMSVSVTPSGPVFHGTMVNLACSSNGNPPVSSFTWYSVKGDQVVRLGVGKRLETSVSAEVHQFYCEGRNDHGRQNSTLIEVVIQCMYTVATRPIQPSPKIFGSYSTMLLLYRWSCSCSLLMQIPISLSRSSEKHVSISESFWSIVEGQFSDSDLH